VGIEPERVFAGKAKIERGFSNILIKCLRRRFGETGTAF
jgi:hypothetical protein